MHLTLFHLDGSVVRHLLTDGKQFPNNTGGVASEYVVPWDGLTDPPELPMPGAPAQQAVPAGIYPVRLEVYEPPPGWESVGNIHRWRKDSNKSYVLQIRDQSVSKSTLRPWLNEEQVFTYKLTDENGNGHVASQCQIRIFDSDFHEVANVTAPTAAGTNTITWSPPSDLEPDKYWWVIEACDSGERTDGDPRKALERGGSFSVPLRVLTVPGACHVLFDPDSAATALNDPDVKYDIVDNPHRGPWNVKVQVYDMEGNAVGAEWETTVTTPGVQSHKLKGIVGTGTALQKGVYAFQAEATNVDNDTDHRASRSLGVTTFEPVLEADPEPAETYHITFHYSLSNPNTTLPPANVRVTLYDPDLVELASLAGGAALEPGRNSVVFEGVTEDQLRKDGDYHFLVDAQDADDASEGGDRGKPALEKNYKWPWLMADNYDELMTAYRVDKPARAHQKRPVTGKPYVAFANGASSSEVIMLYLPMDRLFSFYGHGTAPKGGSIYTTSGAIHAKPASAGENGHFLADLTLTKVRLAVYGACYSADTDTTTNHGNIMQKTKERGAAAAVGFHETGPAFNLTGDGTPDQSAPMPCYYWSHFLWEALCKGQRQADGSLDNQPLGLTDALEYAMEKVKQCFGGTYYYFTDNFRTDPDGINLKIVPAN